MYNQQILISKEAEAELSQANKWINALGTAIAKAVLKGNVDEANELFTQHEDALLNLRMILRAHDLPVPPLQCRVKLPF